MTEEERQSYFEYVEADLRRLPNSQMEQYSSPLETLSTVRT